MKLKFTIAIFSLFQISKLGKEASFPQLSHKLQTTAELENELPDPDSRFGIYITYNETKSS